MDEQLSAFGGMGASSRPAELAETHISVIIFVGDRAYKLKKPVRTAFLDYSTRAAREAICHQEVALNRRLAPDVYLGVVDMLGPDGEKLDHLVAMRRMPSDRRLSTLVADGAATPAELTAVARARLPRSTQRLAAVPTSTTRPHPRRCATSGARTSRR